MYMNLKNMKLRGGEYVKDWEYCSTLMKGVGEETGVRRFGG
jgi:hypothetical protein